MVVGDRDYQLSLSRLAFSFQGAVGMEYLQSAGVHRIQELGKHAGLIAEEIKAGG
jgi:hypothetical protein